VWCAIVTVPCVWLMGLSPNPREAKGEYGGVGFSPRQPDESLSPTTSFDIRDPSPHTGLAVDTTTDHGFEAELKAVEAQVAHVAGTWVRRLVVVLWKCVCPMACLSVHRAFSHHHVTCEACGHHGDLVRCRVVKCDVAWCEC
jgi:hypothetical protein